MEIQEGWDRGTEDICVKNTGPKVVTGERKGKID